jgi:hypothetical protein
VGFNASHSMGLIFGFLALAHGQLLFQSPFLLDSYRFARRISTDERACIESSGKSSGDTAKPKFSQERQYRRKVSSGLVLNN